jgi:hypothetical protein
MDGASVSKSVSQSVNNSVGGRKRRGELNAAPAVSVAQ